MLRTLLPILGLVLVSSRASATWSIVCVDVRTREVGVATATCLESFNLRSGVPVIYVGEGAAAAQSFLDSFASNRRLIFASFRDTEETPAEILARLAQQDAGHQTRQYGIVNFAGAPVTFTGAQAGAAATGVTGQVGDLVYAIQGNILTGNVVVFAAEEAFRTTKGDMGQKLMAAMEAARSFGGDGRCSCSGPPTSCGAPPPQFEKSAHVGCVLIARVGDDNGVCTVQRGCASGEYWLQLNFRGDAADPDPVFVLQERYDKWRANHYLRPDGLNSRHGGPVKLPADGVTERTITVELFDIEGYRVPHGGALVEVATVDGLPPLATIGPVTDLGDGRYTFSLRAGTTTGVDRLAIRATDVNPADPEDIVRATLYPYLEVTSVDDALFVSESEVSAAAGGRPEFVVNRPDAPGAAYRLVARLGFAEDAGPRRVMHGGLPLLPLDQSPFFPAAPQRLDARGRGAAPLDLAPGALAPLVGRRVVVTGYVLDGGGLSATNAAAFDVVP